MNRPPIAHRPAAAGMLAAAIVAAVAGAGAAAAGPQHHPPEGATAGAAADPHANHVRMMAGGGAQPPTSETATADGTIPDIRVVTADGEEVRFYRDLVAGKTVAMNFVFTTCTTICPPMGANFQRLLKLLGDRAGREVHLISVSVDPVRDTPERMKAWGATFGAAAGWTLVTGGRREITELLKALEVFTPDINDHSPVVLVGNDDAGTWTRAYGLAPPVKLLAVIDRVAEGSGGGRKEVGR